MPFFSIIIPTYNRAHTIKRCIDSIVAQSFEDWELIIVDDGSTDGTTGIVVSYKDDRIRYVWQENQERSAARNHGISLAQGEWICFQDSDDEYLPEHFEVLFEGIGENPDFVIIRTGLIAFYSAEKKILSPSKSQGNYDIFPCSCFTSAAFHKSALLGFSFDTKINVAEDTVFLLKLFEKYPIKVLKRHTVLYHLDLNFKINFRSQLNKYYVFLSVLPVINKRKLSVKKQICIQAISILYHGIRERKNVLKTVFINIRCLVSYFIPYTYAVAFFVKSRILKVN